jgi:hypothetical protein
LEKDVVLAEKLMRYERQKRRDPAQEEKKDSSESKMKKKQKLEKDEVMWWTENKRETPAFIYEPFLPNLVHESKIGSGVNRKESSSETAPTRVDVKKSETLECIKLLSGV